MVTVMGRGNVNRHKRADGYGESRDKCENDSASLATGDAPAVNDPGGGRLRERRRANTGPDGDSMQQSDTSTADTTHGSCDNNTTTGCEQLVTAVCTRRSTAEHEMIANGMDVTSESTDVIAPHGDPKRNDMAKENDDRTDDTQDGDIDDVITDFSNIDVSDCETLTENVTTSDTETASDFRHARCR